MTPNERRTLAEYRARELAQLAELEEADRVRKFGGTMRPPEYRPKPRLRCSECGRSVLAQAILARGRPMCGRCAR